MHDLIFISADGFPLSAGPGYVGSILQNHGYSVKLLQSINNFSDSQILELVEKFVVSNKQILCVSITFARTKESKTKLNSFIRASRNKFPDIKVVIGGANNVEPNDYENPTLVILGQNRENEIIDAINRLTGKIKRIPFDFKKHKINYSTLYPGIPPRGINMVLELSKGCIFNCPFCNYSLRGSKSKVKDPQIIIDELEDFHDKFKTSEVLLTCNTFNDDVNKIEMLAEIADKLSFTPAFFAYTRMDLFVTQPSIVHDFYKKFVKYPFFGVESFNPKTLRSINKSGNVDKVKSFLIDFRKNSRPDSYITSTFIVGLPHDTFSSQQDCVTWLNENNVVDFAFFQPLRIMNPKTVEYSISEISEFEKRPEDFGFKVLSVEENKKTFTQNIKKEFDELGVDYSEMLTWSGWEREDGYTSTQSVIDGIKLNNTVKCSVPYNFAMLANSRNLKIDLRARDAFRPTALLKLKPQNYQKYPQTQLMLQNEISAFNNEYFEYILSS